MLKHSDENASWAQCPSNGLNIRNNGYLGLKRGDYFKNNHILINDDDLDNNDSDFNSNA